MVEGGEAAGGLPRQGYPAGVAPEPRDVGPDPGEGGGLVPEASVSRGLLQPEGEEAEGPHPVVDGDQDDPVDHPVVGAVPAAPAHQEGAPGQPHQHGQRPSALLHHRRVNRQVQAVLVEGSLSRPAPGQPYLEAGPEAERGTPGGTACSRALGYPPRWHCGAPPMGRPETGGGSGQHLGGSRQVGMAQ